jgi:hypothetical protein
LLVVVAFNASKTKPETTVTFTGVKAGNDRLKLAGVEISNGFPSKGDRSSSNELVAPVDYLDELTPNEPDFQSNSENLELEVAA